MTSESGSSEERHWLVEPAGPAQISLQFAAGDDVEITPEIRQAFDSLLEALGGGDVEGYATNRCLGFLSNCPSNKFSCNPRSTCTHEQQRPCLIDYLCDIASNA